MTWYLTRRLLITLPVLWGLATVTFLMLALIPGDATTILLGFRYSEEAATALRQELGLDRPLWEQYLDFWQRILSGDLGRSMITDVPVRDSIAAQYPYTIELALAGMAFAIVLGGVAGVIAAVKSRSLLDSGIIVVATLGMSVPSFFLGLLLILLFAVSLGWVPVVGATGLAGLVLPALAVGLPAGAYIARIVRSSMLEVLGSDFLVTAREKGLPESVVIVRHALRNALIPIVTVIGILFGQLLGGAIIVENVFARPGIGRLMVTAIEQRDIPLVQGAVLLTGLTYVLVNLLVDVSYMRIDPRVRLRARP